MGQIASTLKSRNEDCARRRPVGGPPGGQTPPRRGQTLARAWVASGPTRAPPTPPLRLFNLRFGKTLEPEGKSMKSSAAAIINKPISGGFWSSSRHPDKGRNHRRR